MFRHRAIGFALGLALFTVAPAAHAQILLTDTFDDAPSRLWGNERGSWQVTAGEYEGGAPNNNPPTFTSLPYILADLEITCDVRRADDGGIWLHTDDAGLNGVLFVLARGDAYWHNIVGGGAGGQLSLAPGVYTVGQDVHVRITVVGDTYTAYINGSQTPTTTLVSSYPPGRVALYDFRHVSHAYDNVSVSGLCDEPPPGCCPATLVLSPPTSRSACLDVDAHLDAAATGSGDIDYTWQFEAFPDKWEDVADGPLFVDDEAVADLSGTSTGALTVRVIRPTAPLTFRCRVQNECGEATTDPTVLTICAADYNCDGIVNAADVGAFLTAYFADLTNGTLNADFDGNGIVNAADVGAFLTRYFNDLPLCA